MHKAGTITTGLVGFFYFEGAPTSEKIGRINQLVILWARSHKILRL